MKNIHSIESSPETQWLILFDGICGWRTRWVPFLIKYDTHKRFQFAPLQSPLGQHLLATYHFPQENFSTFVVFTPDTYFTKSTDALKIAQHLEVYDTCSTCSSLFQEFYETWSIDLIARYRHQIRGTLKTCYRLPAEHQGRSLFEVGTSV